MPTEKPATAPLLLNERQGGRGGVDAWFATHPLEEERIERTRAMISQFNVTQLNQLTKNKNAFVAFQQRLRSLPAMACMRSPQAREAWLCPSVRGPRSPHSNSRAWK